jgi:transposase InsO family protein
MSHRGNSWDNEVAELFFGGLKKEQVKTRIYKTSDLASANVFEHIEMFAIRIHVPRAWVASLQRLLSEPRFGPDGCHRKWGKFKGFLRGTQLSAS